MLKHQNPEELVDDTEVKEGEILPPSLDPDQFPAETDIEIFVSDGHVNWAQMSNFLRIGMFFIPACLLASTALIGVAMTDFPGAIKERSDWVLEKLHLKSDDSAMVSKPSDGRSSLGRVAYSLFGWDPETAIQLPDGQRVSVHLAFLSQLPAARQGQLSADGFRKLIDDYKATITWRPSEDEQQVAGWKAEADRLEEDNEWNLYAWNLRYQIETTGMVSTKPADIPTVPAQGFWKSESNIEGMATEGVIAKDGPSNYFAAAYVGGVPSVSMFTPSACYTILGVGYDGCDPLSTIQPAGMNHIRGTLFGDLPEATLMTDLAAADEVKAVGEEDRWYLDFPLLSDTSTLSNADFESLFKIVNAAATQAKGISLTTTVTNEVSMLPAPAMRAPAKGLLKNPVAIEAMKKGGVVATTDVPGRLVLAAYVDNQIQVRVRTEGGLCRTIISRSYEEDGRRGCPVDDLSRNVEFQDLVKSLYDQPDTPAQTLKPYFWFADAPMVAEASMDGNDIVRMLNAALQDVGTYGDNIKKWSNSTKLKTRPHVARPEGFFSDPENLEALGTKGVVILPRGIKDTFFLAANYEGRLGLNLVEIDTRGFWNCTTVFGPVRQPIPECRANELTKYSDIIKSMFVAAQ